MRRIAICTDEGHGYPHAPLVMLAEGGGELLIVAMQDSTGYHLTDHYVDGVVGVTEGEQVNAETDEQPICVTHRCLIDHWEDSLPPEVH